ncbi:uncharacterized protein PV09_08889 [Verruconis gallopava]|uniref:Zn(2)-C6 fungal-type domain-containing protein n=1 Tax=Verruconis gallopava TaxID=253628 RepID=A0A0D2AKF6_9PEZI|nr:uncharacterized protein PV09_08889 [Verruconis gallopava]KIV99468.1 hypothetical protein PV09_08889 [Verruconis gallopava]
MPSRAAHTKSRSGCLRCKQRRVKCDEGKPCRDCHRRGELCSLVTDPIYIASFKGESSASAPSSSAGAAPASPYGSHSPATPPQHQDIFSFFSNYTPKIVPSTPYSDWAEDLHLMAHWTAETCFTMVTTRPAAQLLFQKIAPEVGVKVPPLLHIILAIAASHLAYLRPSQREHYSKLSIKHQQHTTQQFQTTIREITKDNIVAIFLTSSLLTVACVANMSLAKYSPDHPPTLDDVVAVFFMTRGVRDVLHPVYDWLSELEIKPILEPVLDNYTLDGNENYELPPILANRMDVLRRDLLDKHGSYHDASKEACHFAILELEKVLRDIAHFPPSGVGVFNPDFRRRKDIELGVLMKWQTTVSATFVNLMKKRHVGALVVLAHWVMLTKHLAPKWFLEGWMESAFEQIRNALKEEDRHWLDWPEEYASQP